ncbi:RpiB/LacA/LacB family sugar-phosphate isomerase [Chloroflexota bacterium]
MHGAVASGQANRGILVCGSSVGACIATNKMPGVRAWLCHDTCSAHRGMVYDEMNVLCLGSCIIGKDLVTELVKAFLNTNFSTETHHRWHVEKVLNIERQMM